MTITLRQRLLIAIDRTLVLAADAPRPPRPAAVGDKALPKHGKAGHR